MGFTGCYSTKIEPRFVCRQHHSARLLAFQLAVRSRSVDQPPTLTQSSGSFNLATVVRDDATTRRRDAGARSEIP